jgi:deoxyadenosine/deoxycytidine kinase
VFGRAGSSKVFNILEAFYAEPSRYAYTFQNYVFMTRFLQEKTTRGSGCPIRIMERSVLSDRNVFTESLLDNGWLTELEYGLYEAWFDPMIKVC